MRKTRTIAIMLVLCLVAFGASSSVMAKGRTLTTSLTGEAEVPGPGDPDGSGEAVITFSMGRSEICFQLNVSNIAPATAAHIHEGAEGVAGGVVVGLTAPTDGSSSECIAVDRELIREILRNPEEYYVNVHNAEFPDGAVRGQLSRSRKP